MLKKLTSIMTGSERRARRSRRGRFQRHIPVAQPEDRGKWIWIDGSEEPRNSHIYARKLFELDAQPSKAIINASADTRYKLYVNGDYIGKGPVRSGSGYTYFDTFDITEHLSKGKNVIAFHVHHIGEPTNFAIAKRPGLICRAQIEVDGVNQTVATDETWKVHLADDWTNQGARLSDALGFQEVYDAALRVDGWDQIKCKEKGWTDAVVVGSVPAMPWGELVEREISPLAEDKIYPEAIAGPFNSPERSKGTSTHEIPAIMSSSELIDIKSGSVKNTDALFVADGITKVSTPRSDVGVAVILDFGREVFGNVEIGVSGTGSGVIDIGYSEITDDSHVKTDRAGVRYTDRVILKKGDLHWQGFEPRAFRYIQLEFRRCSKAVNIEYIRVNQTTYSVRKVGSFECSDNLLNDIWYNSAYTARLCMEDTFIDCPWRERAQWWGDARIQSRAAYYAFNDSRLLAQGLRQIASQQFDDGSMPGMYPGGSDKLVPDFALYWVFSLLDYFAFSDDIELLKELSPNVERLMEWFRRYIGQDGLLMDVPGWTFIDWAEVEKRGEVTALNCMFFHALRVAAAIASVAGKDEVAEDYTEVSAKLRLAINKYLYSPVRGLYGDCRVDGRLVEKFTKQTNAIAALCDVPDHYRKSSIMRVLVGDSLPEVETPYIASHIVEVLCAGDRHVDALHIIRKKWGDMLKDGATTFWEFFSGKGSRCHGWSVGPVRDLIAEFVGIKPVLGAHRFAVTPHVADLKWARGVVETKSGLLTVEWRIVRGVFSVSVDVPEGVKVDVYPPCPIDCKLTVDGKAHAAKFVTLGGGMHMVKVTAIRPAKTAPLDKSLEVKPEPHVEILEDIMPRGRKRLRLATDKKPKKSKRGTAAVVEPEEIALNTVEVVEEVAAEAGVVEEAETTRKSRRKRSRRGGKGRAREVSEAVETAETADVEVTEAVEAVTLVEAEEKAETTGKSRRRRSRRRGRSGSAEVAEATVVTDVVEVETSVEEPEQAAEIEVEEARKPRRRRSRRGGRGRNGATEVVAEVTETVEAVASVEPVVEEQAAEAVTEPALEGEAQKSRRRRSRRGGRGRSRGAASVEQGEAAAVAEPIEPADVAEPVIAPDVAETEEQHSAPRRRRSRRGGRGRTAVVAEAPEQEQPIEPIAPPQPEPVQPEPVAETEPRKRRPRRNGKPRKVTEGEAVAPQEPVAEPAKEPEAAPVEAEASKKRTRRTTRKKAEKPAEEAVQVAEAPIPQPAEPAAEVPKKRRTYTRKPKAKPDLPSPGGES